MIRFLLKGILRDKSRSLLPIIVVSTGVALTVFLSGYLEGVFGDVVDQNARFDTGHVKVMSQAYSENIDQLPNDLAFLGVGDLMSNLKNDYPDMTWVKRIRFGGLIDMPDEEGNSKGQGPAAGIAINILDKNSGEVERMNIPNAIVTGRIPEKTKEALIGHDFADKLKLQLGDEITYFGTTMNSSMTFYSFTISGTVRFGAPAMDKGAFIIDVSDAQKMLDMEDGAGEILGFANNNVYNDAEMQSLAQSFNATYTKANDEFSPMMKSLKQQNNLADLIDYASYMSSIFVFIFVMAMSVVLWNTGLIAGIRRYQEYGIRLALGEAKGTIYRRMIMEASLIGVIGSIIGTLIGLAGTWYMQTYGIDISSMLQDSGMLMPTRLRSKITPSLFFIGFIPGVLAMVLGTMLSGLGIYKRETASLFKELEV